MQQNSSAWTRWAPPVTRNLILINLVLYLASIVLLRRGIDLPELFGLHYIGSEAFRPWQLITYQFLHSTQSFDHVFSNMFALFMFGAAVENVWGQKRFLIYYLLCGISAALVQEVSWWWDLGSALKGYTSVATPTGVVPVAEFLTYLNTIGASGSVFGILLAAGMLFPNSHVFVGFLIPVRMKYFVVLYGLFELFAGIHNTWGNVAHFAHLGGMLGGIILILLWRKRGKIY